MFEKKIFKRKFNEYSGCIHNHTCYSYDTNFAVKDFVKATEQNKLDYVTINDHMTLEVRQDLELRSDKTKIIVGVEINDKNQEHHYLVFNTDKVIANKNVEEYVKEYHEDNAVGFVAHPFEDRLSPGFKKYEWKTSSILPVDGIEIWNFASEWVAKLIIPINGLLLIFFPNIFVRKANKKAFGLFEKYQKLNNRISIIGSTDAHTIIKKILFFKIPIVAHKKLFKTIRTNILLEENIEFNQENILKALKNGNSYVVNYKVGYPQAFYAGICDKNGTGVTFGEEIMWVENLSLFFNLSCPAKIILIKDGKKTAKIIDSKGEFKIKSKGRYRLEIIKFGRGWIYTNYIYVV